MVHAAAISKNLKFHWENILNTYAGQECSHNKITRTLDPFGNVIDESEVSITVYGAISPVGAEAVKEAAGELQYGDLVGYFFAEEGILVGTQINADNSRWDTITYEGIDYTVEKLVVTAYDAGLPVVSKYILRKLSLDV